MAPGGILEGESEHVGIGADPITEHASCMEEENPPCSEIEITSFTVFPAAAVSDAAAGLSEKSGARLKAAVTVWSEFIATEHWFGSAPVQAPLQPLKTEFPEGAAAREMELPGL